jgi:mRNA interferase RelE/StbE
MAWIIEIDPKAEKELEKLGSVPAKRILRFLFDRLAPLENPRQLGDALSGSQLGDYWKFRVGDYRLICDIQDKTVRVVVLRVGHRRDVYKQ